MISQLLFKILKIPSFENNAEGFYNRQIKYRIREVKLTNPHFVDKRSSLTEFDSCSLNFFNYFKKFR